LTSAGTSKKRGVRENGGAHGGGLGGANLTKRIETKWRKQVKK